MSTQVIEFNEVEVQEVSQFCNKVSVTELWLKTAANVSRQLASQCVEALATKYQFDKEEALNMLGLDALEGLMKKMERKPREKKTKEPKSKTADGKEKKSKEAKFLLPFCNVVSAEHCSGLSYNHGLFTQCSKKAMDNGLYCKGCQAQADKNSNGKPDCGDIEARIATGLYEFKDPKGRSPVSYMKVLEKAKLSQDEAVEAATKAGLEIPEEHFAVQEKAKTEKKGRPKKAKVSAEGVEDLFAQLTADGQEITTEVEAAPAKATKKAKLTEEEKAAKKQALEADRAAKKADRDAQKAAEKADKEAKLAAEKADKEAKKAQEKADKEAKKAQEKADKEAKKAQEKADKEAKKAQEKADKEAKKSTKSDKTVVNVVASTNAVAATAVTAKSEAVAPTVTATNKLQVTRISIDGKVYMRAVATNILYDSVSKEEVGIWNASTKKIDPLPEEDDDEEEVGSEYENESD
jgi:chemotaxis protein histidine kinase CheA